MTIDEFKEKVAPYMKKGYVAMDEDKIFWWYKNKPDSFKFSWNAEVMTDDDICYLPRLFNIEPVEDWTQSLIEVGK